MNDQVRILIAEDDAEDRMIITDCFDQIGRKDTLCFVENGIEVLSHLGESSESALPHLIILDLNMPRMNGTDTLRALKEEDKYADIPVMIFSTSVNEIERAQCTALGAVNYLTKPTGYREALEIARFFYDFAAHQAAPENV